MEEEVKKKLQDWELISEATPARGVTIGPGVSHWVPWNTVERDKISGQQCVVGPKSKRKTQE